MEFSAEDMFGEETQPKTLYVGNLNAQMTEEFLLVLFSQIGVVKGCKIIQEILFLTGCLVQSISGGVFWNGKPPLLRLRTRPTRHYSPSTSHHHPNNRVQRPTMMIRYRDPALMKTYRPVNHLGGMILNSPTHHRPRYHRGPQQPFPHVNNGGFPNIQDHPPRNQGIIPVPRHPHPHPTFQSPIMSNLIENPGMKVDSGTNQHGYLSPTYSGWKPISKPHFKGGENIGPYSDGRNYISSTTEPYLHSSSTTRKETVMLDNVKYYMKPLSSVKLRPEYSENQGVTVPRPLDLPDRDRFRYPATTLLEQRPTTQNHFQGFKISTPSQTEEKGSSSLNREKGFPKFSSNRQKLPQVPTDSNSGSEVSTDSPQLLSKFKISRPKLKVKSTGTGFQANEPEIEGLGQEAPPKVTFLANNGNNGGNQPAHHHPYHQGQGINPNPKVHKLRPRVKVKAERRPEGFVNSDELSHVLSYRPPGQTPGSQREKGNSDSGQPPLLPVHHTQNHPSPSYLGNETYDGAPFQRPPSAFPPSPFSTDFMKGFGSDEGRYQSQPLPPRSNLPRQPIAGVGNQGFPGGQVIGGGSKQENVVEKPFLMTGGDGQRGLRRKKPKQQQRHKIMTTTTEDPPSLHLNNNQNPALPYPPPDFYSKSPIGFSRNPSGGGHEPVSFMTMPNSQPQVIHHTQAVDQGGQTPHPYPHHQQEHLYPINFQRSTPVPVYNNYNGQEQESFLGTNPNNAYTPHNKQPFLFMNIQNGQAQGPGPAGQELFGPQHYEGLASSTPFSQSPFHHNHHHHQGHGQDFRHPQQVAGGDLNPPPLYSSQFPERSTTPRNIYRFPIPSPPLENYGYNNYESGGGIQNSGQGHSNFQIQEPNSNNLQAYASNEYERIPLEFMNDLRPILLEESQQPIPTLSSARPELRPGLEQNYNPHQQQQQQHGHPGLQENPSDMSSYPRMRPNSAYPPGSMEHQLQFQSSEATSSAAGTGFMNDFFRAHPSPFPGLSGEETSRGSTNLYPIPQNSYEREEGGENYNSAASNFQPQLVPTPKTYLHPPIISNSPLYEYSRVVTTVSPIHDVDFSRSSPKWSKLKVGSGISSTESSSSIENMTSKFLYSKFVNKGKNNDTGPVLGPEIKLSSSPPSTTKNGEEVPEDSYSHPTPLVLQNMSLAEGSEDETSDSNIPKSVRVKGSLGNGNNFRRPTQKPGPPPTTTTIITRSTSTTMAGTNGTTRPLRRRRPVATPVTLSKRKLQGKEDGDVSPEGTPQKRLFKNKEEDGGGFESSRLNSKPQRRQEGLGSKTDGRRTTPSPGDPNAVTYGESQWFQIKGNPGGEELDHVEEKRNNGRSPPPHQEKKEGGKISFSTRIASKTPHVKLEQFPSLIGSDRVGSTRNL